MHDQEFERSVQQKMDELSFTPSAPVWNRVEAAIQSRRKKRRVVFWLLPLGIALSMAGVEWYHSTIDRKKAVHSSTSLPAHAPGVDRKSASVSEQATENKIKTSAHSAAQQQEDQNWVAKWRKPFSNSGTATREPNRTTAFPNDANNSTPISSDPITQKLSSSLPGANAHTVNEALPLLQAFKANALGFTEPENRTQNIGIAPMGWPRSALWQWSLQLAYGHSNMALEKFLTPLSQDFSSIPGGPLQSGTGSTGSLRQPLPVAAGPFVSVQLGIRKRLASRWYLQTGLQYARYTQKVTVGRQVAVPGRGGAADFFEAGKSGSYFNRFNQAAVPLAVQYKPFRKRPLELYGGLAPAYLFGAQSLRLDTATRLFTEQRPSTRKFQLPVLAGVQYRVAQSRSFEWLASATMQYHLTGVYNRTNAPKLYAFAAGVQLRKK